MLGPNDVNDWEFDRRDALSLLLRRHPIICRLAAGLDCEALDIDEPWRAAAISFARQAYLPMETLEGMAAELGVSVSA